MKENEESTQPGPVDRCSRVVFSTFLSSNVSRTLSQRIHYLNFFFGKDLPQLSYSFIFWDVPRRSRIFHACSFFYRRQHFLKPIYSFAIMITFVFFSFTLLQSTIDRFSGQALSNIVQIRKHVQLERKHC